MKSNLVAIAALAGLAACSSVQVKQPSPGAASVAPEVWENTGTEFPTMCMLLHPDGTLTFRGGFQFYNPGKWRRDARSGELILTLGGDNAFPTEVFKEQLPKHIGALAGYDEKERKVVYRTDAATPFLNFGNFYFYRNASCHAS
jgi:hypothetical protein